MSPAQAQDMGNGTPTVFSFKGPTGKQGTIVDVGIEVTETFACDSTEASFQVGTTSDADAYCKLDITDGTAITDTFNIQNDTNAIIDEALTCRYSDRMHSSCWGGFWY